MNTDILARNFYIPSYETALQTICPGCQWAIDSNNTISYWADSNPFPQPSLDDLKKCVVQIQLVRPMWLLRQERNVRVSATDTYMICDYPIIGSDLTAMKTYRQTLRDLPAYITNNNIVLTEQNYLSYFPTIPTLSKIK